MTSLPKHLLRPALAVVWQELARRLSRGDQPSSLSLNNLEATQQQAIADLLGLDRLPGSKMRLSMARLIAACNFDSTEQLKAVAEAVAGPIVDRKKEREQQQRIKSELWQWLEDELLKLPFVNADVARHWIDQQRNKGVSYHRLKEYRHRYQRMLTVLMRLPADGVSLAVLAADVLGDPHALDSTSSLGRLCIDAYCGLNQIPRDRKAISLRRQWGWAGVTLDGVSSNVLVLGLRTSVDQKHSEWLQHSAECHEPVLLTYRQLTRWPMKALSTSQKAIVVENPSIIEAAAAAGLSTVPLICSAGQPTVAVQSLVKQLATGGAEILQHADFDPAGIHITRWFQTHAATTPWKMTAQDYLQAVRSIKSPIPQPDQQAIPDTPWDLPLSQAMQQQGIYVSEEQVREELLTKIARLNG